MQLRESAIALMGPAYRRSPLNTKPVTRNVQFERTISPETEDL